MDLKKIQEILANLGTAEILENLLKTKSRQWNILIQYYCWYEFTRPEKEVIIRIFA